MPERVLADRRQHREAAVDGPVEEAVVDQRAERVDRPAGVDDRLSGREVERVREGREPLQRVLLGVTEQVVAPVEGRA